jgi:hypothetical protein
MISALLPRTAPPAVARSAARLAAAVLLAAACSQTAAPDGGGTPRPAPAGAAVSQSAVVLVDDVGNLAETGPRDLLRVAAARVDGDTLRLAVEHGGGCREHTYRLVASRAFMESQPPQTRLVLGHDARGDACRALVRVDLAVSLVPLADAVRAGSGTRRGAIVLHLEGYGEALRYEF